MEKRYLKYLVFSMTIVIICIGSLNYIVDPLLYYQRSSRPFPILYSEEQRYQIPGLIKNSRDYNAAIIGTSMAGIFWASEVGTILNEKTVKLSVNGATLKEQSYILSRYLDTHPHAKTIIWVIDPMYFDIAPDIFTIRPYDYPFFLYDDSVLNLRYLLNYEVTIHSLQTIIHEQTGIKFFMKTENLDKIHTWPADTPSGCKQIIANYKEMSSRTYDVLDPILVPQALFRKEYAVVNLDTIVKLAKGREHTQFYFFLPPYSIVRYLFEEENNGLERILQARNFFADRTKRISNIKVIDLQAEEDIITGLDLYFDMIHHNKTINDRLIKNIPEGTFNSYESVLENTEKLRALVHKYDFAEIKKCGLQD